jgi:mono/diheme cytochrome c family protein
MTFGLRARPLALAISALLLTSTCGGAAAQPAATSAPAAATLAPQTSSAAATLAPQTTAPAPQTTAAGTPTASTAATPTAASSASGSSATVVAEGKVVFTTIGPSGKGCQECHGADGKGSTATDGTASPNIRGTTEVKLRNALAGSAALMTNLKLTDRQIEAVLAYLSYLDQQ